MPKNKRTYLQANNVQVAVEAGSQLIAAEYVTQATNDAGQLAAIVEQVVQNTGLVPGEVSADSGYFSEKQIRRVADLGVDPYIATDPLKFRRLNSGLAAPSRTLKFRYLNLGPTSGETDRISHGWLVLAPAASARHHLLAGEDQLPATVGQRVAQLVGPAPVVELLQAPPKASLRSGRAAPGPRGRSGVRGCRPGVRSPRRRPRAASGGPST